MNVYVFVHHHEMDSLLSLYRSDKQRKILLAHPDVYSYYSDLADTNTLCIKFRYHRPECLLFLAAIKLFQLFRREGYSLLVGSYMGLHVVQCLCMFRVKRIFYSSNYVQFPFEEIDLNELSLKKRAYMNLLTLIAGYRIVHWRWGKVNDYGVARHLCKYRPPEINFGFPQYDHPHDLIILDFDFLSLAQDIDVAKSLENIRAFCRKFMSPAIKPHPTSHCNLFNVLHFTVLDSSIPAEALLLENVSLLYFESAASKGWKSSYKIADLLTYKLS